MKNLFLLLAFLLELAVLFAGGYWGFTLPTGIVVRLLAGIGVPVVFGVAWWLFGAPGATFAVHGVGRVVLEILWFGGAAVLFFAAGQRTWALVFGGVYLVTTAALLALN